MRYVEKSCPNCGQSVRILWKRRGRAGYCSLKCAYQHRVIHPPVECRICGTSFKRKGASGIYCSTSCAAKGYTGFKHSGETKEKMRAAWTEERRAAQTKDVESRICLVCSREFSVPISGRRSTKRVCSSECHAVRMETNNPTKDPDVRKKVSEAASNRSEELRRKIGEGVSKAWEDGKFSDVRTGRCDWYLYEFGEGSWKVQGAWELAFIHWLCNKDLGFLCHRGRIRYTTSDGKKKCWYPDFWVEAWQAWVDVKGDHFYDPEKFARIRECNPSINVVVLLRRDLEGLGVKLYAKGSRYYEYLQTLIQRCRIQSGTGKP